jgi:DNA-binding NtrC family response regulator
MKNNLPGGPATEEYGRIVYITGIQTVVNPCLELHGTGERKRLWKLRGEGTKMAQKKLFALLASDGADSFEELKIQLKSQGIEAWSAETCEEIARLLDQTHPELIFTATKLRDGTWSDIVALAEEASVATNVIVVGRGKDIGLYLSTMDYGAFDFVLPPFEAESIAHVVRVAAENVHRRREEQAIRAVA